MVEEAEVALEVGGRESLVRVVGEEDWEKLGEATLATVDLRWVCPSVAGMLSPSPMPEPGMKCWHRLSFPGTTAPTNASH